MLALSSVHASASGSEALDFTAAAGSSAACDLETSRLPPAEMPRASVTVRIILREGIAIDLMV